MKPSPAHRHAEGTRAIAVRLVRLLPAVLVGLALVCALVPDAAAAPPVRGRTVEVSLDAHGDPALSIRPRQVVLGLNDPGHVVWQLDPLTRQRAASFSIHFPSGAPFGTDTGSAAAADACVLGPLSGNDGLGVYDYEVTLLDEGGHAIASHAASLEVVEQRGLPLIFVALAALICLLFLIAAYTERSLTRSYDPPAH